MPPDVSVLLPARNAGATLAAALESVRRQRDIAIECVVVDDGSQDDTRSIAEEVARRDPRFHVLARPPRGLVAALNDGLAADPTLSGVGCHVRLFPRAHLKEGLRAYERWLDGIATPEDVAREAFVECPLAHPTLFIRREVLVAARYREAGWPEDYDLLLRLLAAGHRMGVVPRRLVAWRDHPARRSRTHPDYAIGRFVACKAHHLAEGFLRASAEYVLWGHGRTGRALRRALLAEGRRASYVIEVDPRKLGQHIDGAPVVSPDALDQLRGRPLVASVAGARARAEIRAALAARDFTEGRDFVCAA